MTLTNNLPAATFYYYYLKRCVFCKNKKFLLKKASFAVHTRVLCQMNFEHNKIVLYGIWFIYFLLYDFYIILFF